MTTPTNCLDCEHSRLVEVASRQIVVCDTRHGRRVVVTSFGRRVNLQSQVVKPGDECPRRGE